MMDIVPRPNRKWGVALLVLLCVSAILFITPWFASSFFFPPYENWSQAERNTRPEKLGNTTWLCTPSGPCVGCTSSEKQDPSLKCKPTGYHVPQKCVEDHLDSKKVVRSGENDSASGKERTQMTSDDPKVRGTSQEGSGSRRILQDEERAGVSDEVHVDILYKSCLPPEVREKLSVLGFEGVVMGLLALTAPVVYFRKKKAAAHSPMVMQRVPSSARF